MSFGAHWGACHTSYLEGYNALLLHTRLLQPLGHRAGVFTGTGYAVAILAPQRRVIGRSCNERQQLGVCQPAECRRAMAAKALAGLSVVCCSVVRDSTCSDWASQDQGRQSSRWLCYCSAGAVHDQLVLHRGKCSCRAGTGRLWQVPWPKTETWDGAAECVKAHSARLPSLRWYVRFA